MLMTMLNPNQIQTVNNFKQKPREEQAQIISQVCNQKGINQDQLQSIIDTLKRLNIRF